MAQKMQILPADDTGSSATAAAARSGLDGTGFETGLNAGHSRQLRAKAQGTEVKDRGRNPPGRPPSSKRRSASKRAAQSRYQ